MFGIVKETGVDDDGLYKFQNNYFSRPMYKDEEMNFYNFVGSSKIRKMSGMGLLKMIWNIPKSNRRWRQNDIESNLSGEGLIQGGVVIFDKDGKQKYAYQEETGKELPVDDIIAAVNAVKE